MQQENIKFKLIAWKPCENLNISPLEAHLMSNSTQNDLETQDINEFLDYVQTIYERIMFFLLPLNLFLNGIALYVFGRYHKNILPEFMSKLCGADMVYGLSLLIILILHKIYLIQSANPIVPLTLAFILISSIFISMNHIYLADL